MPKKKEETIVAVPDIWHYWWPLCVRKIKVEKATITDKHFILRFGRVPRDKRHVENPSEEYLKLIQEYNQRIEAFTEEQEALLRRIFGEEFD